METGELWRLADRRGRDDAGGVLAVDERGGTLTFGALRTAAERVAAGLAESGLRPGEVVSWQLPNRLSTIVLMTALSRLGVVQNPLVTMLREREVGFICAQADTRLLVVPGSFRGFDHEAMARAVARKNPRLRVLVIDDGLPEAPPDRLPPAEPAATGVPADSTVRWYFYTSGTTSAPKGARHRDSGVVAAADAVSTALGVTAQDRVAALAPLAHIGGVAHVVGSLRTGSTLILSEVFDPNRTPLLLREQGVTLVGSGVPFIRAYLAFHRAHPEYEPLFPRARAFLSGGSGRPPGLHDEVRRELGTCGVVSGYGLTECPHLAWATPEDDDAHLAATEGRPSPGVRVSVVTPDERDAAPGEEGELRVVGPQLMAGYVDAALDAEAFDSQGRFRTGDLGRVDAEGYLTITGRLKDVIIRNMENVSAREIEDLLISHAGVEDVAVVGLPDPDTGERVCAVVVPADPRRPPELAELAAFLRASGMSTRKLPEQLCVLAELPRNAMGKVVKPVLRERLMALPAPERAAGRTSGM